MYASDTGHADGVPHSGPLGTQFEVPMKGNYNFPELKISAAIEEKNRQGLNS